MAKKKVDWVFMDSKTTELFCDRCGERRNIKDKLPLSISDFCNVMEGFAQVHSICKESNGKDGASK